MLTGRPELLLVGVPLAIRLLVAAAPRSAPRYALTHEVTTVRLFEGERLGVSIALTAETGLPLAEVLEPLPVSARLLSGSPRTVVSLRAGETVRWRYELAFPERGHMRLGALHLRFWDPSGLRVTEAAESDPKIVRVYPRTFRASRLPTPLRTQTSVGNYVSPVVGEGIEPGEIRLFAPGDRIRHVNWRASLRTGRLFVTRYHEERNADVVLMIDTLSAVGRPPATTLDTTLRAAASLAAAYLARKDRVGLIEYGGLLRWVRPGSGRLHFERLLDTLLRAQVTFTYVAKDLDTVPPRVLPPQALVIALTPLLDPRFTDTLADLAGRGFDLVVLIVDPVGPTREGLGATALNDTVCRLWSLERSLRLAELIGLGLRVVEWKDDEPIELALSRVASGRRPRAAVEALGGVAGVPVTAVR